MTIPENSGFEPKMEDDDYKALALLRQTLGLETELVFTVATFADLRIQRLTHELGEARQALKQAAESINELVSDPASDFGPAYEGVKERKERALKSIKKALK